MSNVLLPPLSLPLLSVRPVYRSSGSKVSSHAQQQQDVHRQQVEATQQRCALTGAEGHSQHSLQTRASSPSLSEWESHVRGNNRVVVPQYFCNAHDEPYPSDGSLWWVDENWGLGVISVRIGVELGRAATVNVNNYNEKFMLKCLVSKSMQQSSLNIMMIQISTFNLVTTLCTNKLVGRPVQELSLQVCLTDKCLKCWGQRRCASKATKKTNWFVICTLDSRRVEQSPV